MRYPKKNLQLSIFIQDFFFSFFGFMSQWLQTTKQGYRTKEKELRRKNLNWGIHPEKEIQLTVYDEVNFSANIYCKTEKSLKLEHKTKTFLFEKLLYEIWEPIRLSNLIYKQILIAMNILTSLDSSFYNRPDQVLEVQRKKWLQMINKSSNLTILK